MQILCTLGGRLKRPASPIFRNRAWIALPVAALPLLIAIWTTSRFSSGLNPIDTVGKPVPDFSLNYAGGGKLSSHDLIGSGGWSLVVFWTTSCVECRAEAPELRRIVELPPQGLPSFRVVSINIGDAEPQVLAWMADQKLPFNALMDSTQAVAHSFGVSGVPESYFVDPLGVVRYRAVGSLSTEEMERVFELLVAEANQR